MMDLDTSLIAHWPLMEDARNRLAPQVEADVCDVTFDRVGAPGDLRPAAVFNGRTSQIQTPLPAGIRLGDRPFAVSLWLHHNAGEGDLVGDLLACFDPDRRRGFTLSVLSNSGVTSAPLTNDRHLHFGIDQAQADTTWLDHGRPGCASKIAALHVHDGHLYAGTLELGAEQTGHLWRYEGESQWLDLGGSPDGANTISSITHFQGQLYCSTGRYNPLGSALPPMKNTRPGGHVHRIEADGSWTDCGLVGAVGARPDAEPVEGYFTDKADETICLMPWRGELLAISHHRKGVWRYQGDRQWEYIGPEERLFSITVYQGDLYCMVNGGQVMRYLGEHRWEQFGKPETSRQTYSAAIYENKLYVGTWPEGEIYRHLGGTEWQKLWRLGFEREVMGMSVYNGKLYAGSLPMAHVFRLDGDYFTFVGNLDDAPVVLRRVWTLAVYRGRLFGGTLPQGRVRSFQAGIMATTDRSMPTGWHHIAAVRERDRLRLYVDGKPVAKSVAFQPSMFNLDCDRPLRIGCAQHAALHGALADVRLYDRALDPTQVQELASQSGRRP